MANQNRKLRGYILLTLLIVLIVYIISAGSGCAEDTVTNNCKTSVTTDCNFHVQIMHRVENAVEVFEADCIRYEGDQTNYYVILEGSTIPFVKDSVDSFNAYKCK